MRTQLVMVLIAGLLVAADQAKEKAKSDKEGLQGTWELVSLERGGKLDKDAMGTVEFKGDQFTMKPKGRPEQQATYKLGTTQKLKTIDFTLKDPQANGPREMKGLYELKGNQLRLCFGPPDQGRPKELSGKDAMLLTFKRAKP